MRAIRGRCKCSSIAAASVDKLAVCDKHFHQKLFIKENVRICLKYGASPTMFMSTFQVTNEGHD